MTGLSLKEKSLSKTLMSRPGSASSLRSPRAPYDPEIEAVVDQIRAMLYRQKASTMGTPASRPASPRVAARLASPKASETKEGLKTSFRQLGTMAGEVSDFIQKGGKQITGLVEGWTSGPRGGGGSPPRDARGRYSTKDVPQRNAKGQFVAGPARSASGRYSSRDVRNYNESGLI